MIGGYVGRRLVWNLLAATLFLILAAVLSIPVWARVVLIVAAGVEIAFALLARSILRRRPGGL